MNVKRRLIEARVRNSLDAGRDRGGGDYDLIACDPDLADTANFCAAYGFDLDASANTILVTGKADPPIHVACIALATTRLDVNGLVRRRLGVRKASFSSAADTISVTGMEIGGVTPFGLPDGAEVEVWIDDAVMQRPRLILGGGSRALKVLTEPRMLLTAPRASVVVDLARPIAPPGQ